MWISALIVLFDFLRSESRGHDYLWQQTTIIWQMLSGNVSIKLSLLLYVISFKSKMIFALLILLFQVLPSRQVSVFQILLFFIVQECLLMASSIIFLFWTPPDDVRNNDNDCFSSAWEVLLYTANLLSNRSIIVDVRKYFS